MSDEEDRDAPGLRPRRATISARRRSLRVPVDEVPRRSSPAMTRPVFEKPKERFGSTTERSLPRVVSAEPLPALHTDPGLNVELVDEDIEVEESREMESVAAVSVPAADASPPVRLASVPPLAALDEEDSSENDMEMVLASAELEAGAFGDLASEPTHAVASRTSPEGEVSPAGLDAPIVSTDVHAAVDPDPSRDEPADLAPEPTQVSTASLELLERMAPEPRPQAAPVSQPPAPLPEARPSVPEARVSAPEPARTSSRPSAPVVISPVVVVSRSITVVGSPSSPPPRPSLPVVEPSVIISAELSEPEPVEVDIEEPAMPLTRAEPAKAEPAKAEEPERTSSPDLGEPDLASAEELAADELLEDAPPVPKTHRSSPPPRPERPVRPSIRTPSPQPSVSTSGPPPAGSSVPHLPPPPPVPSIGGAHKSGSHASPYASGAAAAPAPPPPAPAAAPVAAAPEPHAPHVDPPTDPRRSKKKGSWWEDLFNDDYLRTVPAPHPRQVVRQCDFIESRLGLVRGATLLDVGCGLGLHAIELTRRGYLVVGLDLSLPMLSRAADEAQDQGFKINFLHADMREMNFEGAFDAVLSWGTSFGYFDDDVNRGVLERIHRALKPGGLLLLDLVNRDYVIRTQPNNVWFEGDGCVVMEETQCNYISSRLHVKRTVMLDDGRQRESAYAIRLYSLHELGQMLHKSFRVVEVSGREATPGVFFGADSPRLLVVAERRAAAPPAGPPAGPPAPPKKHEGDAAVSASMPAIAPGTGTGTGTPEGGEPH